MPNQPFFLSWPALAAIAALAFHPHPGFGQTVGSAITYQGELRASGSPAFGNYDFQFRLFDGATSSTQIGPTVSEFDVTVSNGVFTLALDFGLAQFAGDAQWLEIDVRPAGGGTFETLVPRTAVTAAPYALGAVTALAGSVTDLSIVDGSVGSDDINPAEVQRRVSAGCGTSQAIQTIGQDGSVTCGDVGAGTLTGLTAGAGLSGGGTNGAVSLGIAPGGVGSGEIDPAQVQARVTGTCPAGQYVQGVNEDGSVNCQTDTAGGPAWGLTGNTGTQPARDFIGTLDAQPLVLRVSNQQVVRYEPSAELFGGVSITANVIAGSGANAVASGARGATIAGGGVTSLESEPTYTNVGPNQVADHYGTVGGGSGNLAGDEEPSPFTAPFATVAGGQANAAEASWATVGGGRLNVASGQFSAVGGGSENDAGGSYSTVGGGLLNTATGQNATVGGGIVNSAGGSRSVIAGGAGNSAGGDHSIVAGGEGNVASGSHGTVAGGQGNIASDSFVGFGTVGGGRANLASAGYASVIGGEQNTASASHGTVSGGKQNCAGGWYSWAGGRRAKVRVGTFTGAVGDGCNGVASSGDFDGDNGTFVWADAGASDLVSIGPNQFLVQASGGLWFGSNSVPSIPAGRFINTSSGAHLTTGGTWTNASSRKLKTGFQALDAAEILNGVLALPLKRWVYRASPEEGSHLGPVAEDFYAAFELGSSGEAISTVDANGVALAAIQGLNTKLETENAQLKSELEKLRSGLAELARSVRGRDNGNAR